MIALDFENIEDLKRLHSDAVVDYVTTKLSSEDIAVLYRCITALPHIGHYPNEWEGKDTSWLNRFILADLDTLKDWVENYADKLKFDTFKKLYKTKFSNGKDKYVDSANTYNSYTLFDRMGIKVCPYCEDEYIEEVTIDDKSRRTMEFDHFYPKGEKDYPGLAMCFYNLIPSCIKCNRLKMANPISANPYFPGIENLTRLYPDLPVGINFESITETECRVGFHAQGDMILNEKNLALEQRYEQHKAEAYQLLSKKQRYPKEKIEEMERAGFGTYATIIVDLFGKPRSEAKGKELHTKMKEDLIGY